MVSTTPLWCNCPQPPERRETPRPEEQRADRDHLPGRLRRRCAVLRLQAVHLRGAVVLTAERKPGLSPLARPRPTIITPIDNRELPSLWRRPVRSKWQQVGSLVRPERAGEPAVGRRRRSLAPYPQQRPADTVNALARLGPPTACPLLPGGPACAGPSPIAGLRTRPPRPACSWTGSAVMPTWAVPYSGCNMPDLVRAGRGRSEQYRSWRSSIWGVPGKAPRADEPSGRRMGSGGSPVRSSEAGQGRRRSRRPEGSGFDAAGHRDSPGNGPAPSGAGLWATVSRPEPPVPSMVAQVGRRGCRGLRSCPADESGGPYPGCLLPSKGEGGGETQPTARGRHECCAR